MAIKRFSDYETTQAYSNSEKLPVGGYVIKIENVRFENGTNGGSDRIVLAFDIAEGEQKGFYRKNFDAQTGEDRKWKGTYIIYLPKDDGSEQDKWTKRRFKTIMEHIEDANPGYSWNWDENSLKGKLLGALFGEINTVIDGKQITYVALRFTEKIANIRNKQFKIPEPYNKNGATVKPAAVSTQSSDGFMEIPKGVEEEIPF